MRVGFGYDVHKLVPDRKLILGGVEIPYEKGLLGHSDADVLVHAIMDALLGSAGMGDIGIHFPDTDDSYKGISSMILLEIVNEKLNKKGYVLGNIDSTIVAQEPKLAEYIPKMVSNIVEVLKIDKEQVNIKATTTEGLGFEGKKEGISAYAAACVIKIREGDKS
ncbi:MAG: 2-C-methyl-D-erythritol 2,4-cyclodiphosphate synthase [Ignavibacteriales bacterium]